MNDIVNEKQISIDFYISKYFFPLFEKKNILISFAVITFSISFGVSLFINSEYESQATLIVEEPRSTITSNVDKEVGVKNAETNYVIAETEKLKGDTFAEEVLKLLPDELKEDLKINLKVSSQIIEGFKDIIKKILGEKAFKALKSFMGKKIDPQTEFMQNELLISEMKRRVNINSKASRAMVWISAVTLKKETAPILVKSYIDVWMAINIEENKKGIRNELEIAEKQRTDSNQQLLKAEDELIEFKKRYEIPADIKSIPDTSIQLEMERLQSKLNFAKDRFVFMDKIYLETRRKESGVIGNIRVINPPIIPMKPLINAGFTIVMTGCMIGIMFGIGIVLVLDFIKGTIRHENDIISTVNLQVIGQIPKI
ncbi:MAG: hypothetical protein HQK79_01910 [Desulfobacterales bacterium]|nr:hypothetical protein [Desulfobacterales bacterium]MBF0398404.1 hypothetical protein [Desulfobacterales bacterium]